MIINSLKNKKLVCNENAGMTLVELLVVLAIFLMVAGLTIFDYGKFRSNVSLQNLADDIALSVRRAQNYAIGVHSSGSTFSNGYGIHFSTANPSLLDARAGSTKSFIIFSDLPPADRIYNYPMSTSNICSVSTSVPGDECIDMLNISTSDIISAICPNSANCDDGYADITFLRPDPDATICVGPVGGLCSGPLSSVDIVIKNTQSEETRTITVSSIGQISIR